MQLLELQLGCHAIAGCLSDLKYTEKITTGLPCSCSNTHWVAMQPVVAQVISIQKTTGLPCSCLSYSRVAMVADANLHLNQYRWITMQSLMLQLGCHAAID